jgi:hypothetical protein
MATSTACTTHAPVDIDDKLFRIVRISSDPEAAAEALSHLTKDSIRGRSLDALWHAEQIDRRVREAVEALFTADPDPWLVRRLRRDIPDLQPGDIRSALVRARLSLDFPPSALTDTHLPAPSGDSAPRDPAWESDDRPGAERAPGRRRRRRVNVVVRDLIDAGLLRPPLDLVRTYLGREVRARVEVTGQVAVNGKLYSSLSRAASAAREEVKGGLTTESKRLHTNGWTFWQYRDGDGALRELDILRRRYHDNGAVADAPSSDDEA